MSRRFESAQLVLKLYSLRREQKLREARDWVNKFNPKSPEEIMNLIKSPDGGKLWMVTGYWEMAASIVNHGAIDKDLFNQANSEHLFLFAKLQPWLPEMRKMDSHFLENLEKLVMKMPKANETMESFRKMMDSWAEKKEE